MANVFILFIVLLITSGIGIVMYLLQAVGLYNMGKTLQLSKPWLSFIPVANVYALGKIAENYIKADGRKSARFSIILLILYIALYVILFAFFIFAFILFAVELASDPAVNAYLEGEHFAATAAFTVVLPLVIGYVAMLGLSIALMVVLYVAYWRVFAIFDRQNATMYLVLSIFFTFLTPIFLFVLRNRQPEIFTPQQNIM